MIIDKLYELAFEYKATKLWRKLFDTDIFAVKLSNGKIGYVSIMGMAREHNALALYVGDEGLKSLSNILFGANTMQLKSPFEVQEILMKQDCLQCAFECKDMLTNEEYAQVKKYALAHNIRFRGRNSYPQFLKYSPNCYPWSLQNENEQKLLCEALAAAIEVSKRIEKVKNIPHLGCEGYDDVLALFEKKDGKYVLSEVNFPKFEKEKYVEPEFKDIFAVEKLKRNKKQGVWESEIIRVPEPVQINPNEAPVFPILMLVAESESGFLLPPTPILNYEENPVQLQEWLVKAFVEQGIYPNEIRVRDERTHSFLKSFCKKTGIRLCQTNSLPAIEEAEFDLWQQLNDIDELGFDPEEFICSVMNMSDSQLEDLPDELVDALEDLLEEGLLPEELELRLIRIFGF